MDQDSNDNSINNDIIEQILEAEAIPNLNELKAEIRAEVRTEVIAELKEELRAQIRGEFQGQLDDLKSNEGKKAFKCTAEANIEDMDTESLPSPQNDEGVHEHKKQFKCSFCDYCCSLKGNLNKHIASIHEGKKPFKCTICDYSCSQKGNLTKHIT